MVLKVQKFGALGCFLVFFFSSGGGVACKPQLLRAAVELWELQTGLETFDFKHFIAP